MVLVTLAWMTQFPGCQNCLDVTTWYATILTDGETGKLLLLRNILMQIGSWWVGSDYLDENGCSGTIKVRNSRPVHVPGPIGSNRYWYVYGSGIPVIQVIPTHPPRTYLHQDVAQKQQFVSLSVGKNSCIPRCDYQAIVTTWRVCHPGKCDQYHGVTMV